MQRDLTTGNPLKLIIKFAVPMVLANILQQFYHLANSIIVGRYVGEDALAAVGTTTSISNMVLMLMAGATSGMAVVSAQFYAAGDRETLKKTVVTSAYLVFLLGLILGFAGAFFSEELLRLINVPDNIMADASVYMKITLYGAVATGFYNMSSSLLRSMGDSLTPLIALAVSCVLNVGLALLFAVKLGMAVEGVAIATVIATTLSAIFCIVYGLIKVPVLRFGRRHLRPEARIIKMISKIGFPSALLSSTVSLGMIMIQALINTFGSTVMAGYAAAFRLEGLFGFPASTITMAAQIFTGQNAGVGRYDRVKAGFRAATKLVLGWDAIAMVLMFIFGKAFLGLFVKDSPEVINVGYQYVRMIALGLPFVGMLLLTRNTMMGAGDAMVPFIMGVFELVSRFLCSFFLSIPFGYQGVFLGTPLAWFTACAFGVWRYRSGKWMTKGLTDRSRGVNQEEQGALSAE